MWVESQDKKHLVNIDRIHKEVVEHVKRERVISPFPFTPVEINETITYTYQILDENGLILGEYSTEEQVNEVWKQLIEFIKYGMSFDIEDMTLYKMPEDKKEVSEDEKTCN